MLAHPLSDGQNRAMLPRAVLPIDAVLPAVLDALAASGRAVLVAPPGAGKTTRVPLALLDAPWRGDGRIIVLEPRRLAARAAARRMAETLGESVGETVGYRVRLESRVSARTRVEVVTEGVFTRQILGDPELAGVAAVLFDEFHERSLEGDLGLALTLDAAAALRPDLRILPMSATLDGARVARLLGDAPVIAAEGRAFSVLTRYLPRGGGDIADEVAAAVRRALAEEPGSVLAFLPGQGEIRRTAERLEGRLADNVETAPLYGALAAAQQDRAIRPAPQGRRKVVLATSIAETSLTIEGVRIVVDSGLARVPRFDVGSGLMRLETRRVSRASADQRRGRAGRTAPGVCYRLWAEGETAGLDPFDRPAILEADLSGLVLDVANWGVTDPASLAWLDPPPLPAWDEALRLLQGLDALDEAGRITAEGRALANLPLHPRLAHMVRRGAAAGQGRLAAEIAVLISEEGLGGRAVDLGERLAAFARDRSSRSNEARRLAARWAALGGAADREDTDGDPGLVLAAAYPDRIAQGRGAPGTFRLAGGRGARMDETERLARARFLVVADLTGGGPDARIRLAAELGEDATPQAFADRITAETTLAFDPAARAVRARARRRLGALVLSDAAVPITDRDAASAVLAAGLAGFGPGALPWSREQKSLRARAAFLSRLAGEPWPDLSDSGLAATAGDWLPAAVAGKTALAEVTAEDLSHALDRLLPWRLRAELDRLAPSHFDAPSGSRVPIDYADENGPVLAIRVQELFGLDMHPSVAGGRAPLLLSLLSPAQRPIQTTRDLPGFWRGSWRDVRADLRGRYPKHPWPEDPLHAPPTRRANPRRS